MRPAAVGDHDPEGDQGADQPAGEHVREVVDLEMDPRPADENDDAEGDAYGCHGRSRWQAAAGDERHGQEEGRGLGGVGAGEGPVRGQADEQLLDLWPWPADEQFEQVYEDNTQAEAGDGQQEFVAAAAGHRQGGHGQGRGQEYVQRAQPGDGQEKGINGGGWLHGGGGLGDAGWGDGARCARPDSLPANGVRGKGNRLCHHASGRCGPLRRLNRREHPGADSPRGCRARRSPFGQKV